LGNLDKFNNTIDPNNNFSGQSPGMDGLLDKVADGACYKRISKILLIPTILFLDNFLEWMASR